MKADCSCDFVCVFYVIQRIDFELTYQVGSQCILRRQTSRACVAFGRVEFPIAIASAPKRKISQHHDDRGMTAERWPCNISV